MISTYDSDIETTTNYDTDNDTSNVVLEQNVGPPTDYHVWVSRFQLRNPENHTIIFDISFMGKPNE